MATARRTIPLDTCCWLGRLPIIWRARVTVEAELAPNSRPPKETQPPALDSFGHCAAISTALLLFSGSLTASRWARDFSCPFDHHMLFLKSASAPEDPTRSLHRRRAFSPRRHLAPFHKLSILVTRSPRCRTDLRQLERSICGSFSSVCASVMASLRRLS